MNGDSTQINCEIGVRLFEFLVKLYVSGKVDDRIRVAAFAVIANVLALRLVATWRPEYFRQVNNINGRTNFR